MTFGLERPVETKAAPIPEPTGESRFAEPPDSTVEPSGQLTNRQIVLPLFLRSSCER